MLISALIVWQIVLIIVVVGMALKISDLQYDLRRLGQESLDHKFDITYQYQLLAMMAWVGELLPSADFKSLATYMPHNFVKGCRPGDPKYSNAYPALDVNDAGWLVPSDPVVRPLKTHAVRKRKVG